MKRCLFMGGDIAKPRKERHYEKLREYAVKLEEYVEKIKICGKERNSYSKTDHSATFYADQDGLYGK